MQNPQQMRFLQKKKQRLPTKFTIEIKRTEMNVLKRVLFVSKGRAAAEASGWYSIPVGAHLTTHTNKLQAIKQLETQTHYRLFS